MAIITPAGGSFALLLQCLFDFIANIGLTLCQFGECLFGCRESKCDRFALRGLVSTIFRFDPER
jgi:hypothetical protein